MKKSNGLLEFVASLAAGSAARAALERWLESSDGTTLEQKLRDLGVSDQGVLLAVARLAEPVGKWLVRLALAVANDPEKRAVAKRVCRTVGEIMKAYVDNQHTLGGLYPPIKE